MEWVWYVIASIGAGIGTGLAMFAISFVAGFLVLILTWETELWSVLLLSCVGALFGAATELLSPSEYDTVTVPVAITVVLLLLSNILR